MATISGKDGTVSIDTVAVLDATGWQTTYSSNNPAYGSTDTAGWKNRVAGVKDSNGNYEAKYNGAIATTAGQETDGDFTLDGAATYDIPSIIDQISLEVDMDDGDVVGYTNDFSGNGAITIS